MDEQLTDEDILRGRLSAIVESSDDAIVSNLSFAAKCYFLKFSGTRPK